MNDDRRTCRCCAELRRDGVCSAAARQSRLDVSERYTPAQPDDPRRCEFYAPLPGDPDQRPGCERYPTLWAEYQERLAELKRVRREAGERGVARAKAVIG